VLKTNKRLYDCSLELLNEASTSQGANRPRCVGESARGRTSQGANRLGGETAKGRISHNSPYGRCSSVCGFSSWICWWCAAADQDDAENRLHRFLFKNNFNALVKSRPKDSANNVTNVHVAFVIHKLIELVSTDLCSREHKKRSSSSSSSIYLDETKHKCQGHVGTYRHHSNIHDRVVIAVQ